MNLNSGIRSASALGRKECTKGILKGLFVSMGMGCSTVGLVVTLPATDVASLAAVLLVPFLIALRATRNVLIALTLTWLNEAIFGVGGHWITLGPVNGRPLLLLCLCAVYLLSKLNSGPLNRGPAGAKELIRNYWVLFYAFGLPFLLGFYAITLKGVAASAVFSDVSRFLTILGYFPLYYCLKKLRWFLVGYLLAGPSLLAATYILIAVAPGSVQQVLMEKWFLRLGVGANETLTADVMATGRVSFVPGIYCIIGLFLALLLAIKRREVLAKVAGFATVLATVSYFVISFARGPLLGISVALLVVFAALLGAAEWRAATRLVAIVAALVTAGTLFTLTYLPISMGKWDVMGQDFEGLIDPVRVEQTQLMLQTWWLEPVLGSGVGSPIPGYTRTEADEGLAFEVQYPMVLYRTGIVGIILILTPFILFPYRSLKFLVRSRRLADSPAGLINLAMCAAVIALLVASTFNPYLASSMAVVFMALLMASDSAINCECHGMSPASPDYETSRNA
jgi:hypothetical protein